MKKLNYAFIIIAAGIIITFIIIAVIDYKSSKETEQMQTTQAPASSTPASDSTMEQAGSEALEPLPSNTTQAVDSEIQAVTQEIDSLTDENLDDLSGLENSL